MKAAVVTEFGDADVLRTSDFPDPVPGPGEALVEVAAADVIWVETMIRRGAATAVFDHSPPYVPGGAVAGRVIAIGDGADPHWVGKRVAAHTGQRNGYAEQVAVHTDALIEVPDVLDLQQAAALMHDGATAVALIEGTRVRSGERVLVVGASGGLGIVTTQFAVALGAHVTATARDEHKLARVRALGAHEVIETDELKNRGLTPIFQVILDNIGGEAGEAAFRLIADGGRFSAHGTPSGRFAQIDPDEAAAKNVEVRGIQHVQQTPQQLKRNTERAFEAAADGYVKPVIGQIFTLDEAAKAHEAIERRDVFGKTLLVPGGNAETS
jgi:NADPH2:quinone reductase